MEPRVATPKPRNVPAFVLGLLIGVVVAGLGAYFYITRAESDLHSAYLGSDTANQQDGVLGNIKHSDTAGEMRQLQELIQHQSAIERAVTLQRATAGASREELVALFEHAAILPQATQRDQIQAAIVRQLAQLDPRSALSHIDPLPGVRRSRLTGIVFQEWSVMDLEKALEFAVDLRNGNQMAALEGILRSRIDLSDTALWDIARQLGNEQLILDHWARFTDQGGIDDPSFAWGDFLTIHGGEVDRFSLDQRNLLVNIARAWIVRAGIGDMIQGMSITQTDYGASVSLVEFLLESLVADDPSIVVDAAASMNDEVRSIVMNALANLAARDPESALKIAVMMEGASNQVVLQRAALGAWIDADPKAALEARDGLPHEFKPWIEQQALMSMVSTLPEEVPPFLSTITDATQIEIVVINLGRNWAQKDPMAVFEWLESEPKAKPWYGHVLNNVIENLTKQDPEKAIRFALEQPVDDYYGGFGWEVAVVWTVAERDIDAALALIDHARDEGTRDYMLQSIGGVIRNRGEYERAMDWAEHLKDESRETYYVHVVLGWVSDNPVELYEYMEKLPSDAIKEEAAKLLTALHETQQALTGEQIESLSKYLSAEESNTN